MLAAYWRGRSIIDAKLAPGAMAAVGLSWEQCEARCPPDVVPACHNAADSVTVNDHSLTTALNCIQQQLNCICKYEQL